ncbi:hypothetical protein Bca4012_058516 [Brassica carinata]
MSVGILWLIISKEGECFFLSEGSTHAELVAMAQEDYNLDMSTESVEITYSFGDVEHPLGGSVQADTPRSVVGSRFSEGPLP